jgi:hypothetical protein
MRLHFFRLRAAGQSQKYSHMISSVTSVTPEMNALTLTKSDGAVSMLRGGPVFSESEVGDPERLQE